MTYNNLIAPYTLVDLLLNVLEFEENIFNVDYFLKVAISIVNKYFYEEKEKNKYKELVFDLISNNLGHRKKLFSLRNVFIKYMVMLTNSNDYDELSKLTEFLGKEDNVINDNSFPLKKRHSGYIEPNEIDPIKLFNDLEVLLKTEFYKNINLVNFFLIKIRKIYKK